MRLRRFTLRAAALLLAVSTHAAYVSAGEFPTASENEFREILNKVRAAHFLSRTTFGPTTGDIDDLADRIAQIGRNAAFEEWIDDQFTLPVSGQQSLAETMVTDDGFVATQSSVGISRYRHYAWWYNACTADDQLRHRMAWALAQIFVVGESGNNFNSNTADNQGVARWLGMANYYDMLLNNSFGNYRDCLLDVTLHPIMGVWLSHVNNRKATATTSPDENYAREVQQLFSIGIPVLTNGGEVVMQNGVPLETYDNEDIKVFARVFTGLSYAGNGGFNGQRNYSQPMVMYESQHDTDEKVLHNGTVLPAGQTGMDDINGALDNLFNHPNCPPFMARRLIMRLVKSNPSSAYINRVANAFIDNGSGVRGDFKAVIKAIFLDPEAVNSLVFSVNESGGVLNSLGVQTRGTEFSRLREPVLRYTAMIRAFNLTTDFPTGRMMIFSQYNDMNQAPYQSPTVFNFYDVEFKPQGDLLSYVPSPSIPNGELVAPEFQIFTPVSANRLGNQFRADTIDQKMDMTIRRSDALGGNFAQDITFDFTEELDLAENDPLGLVRHLDLLLCYGSMREEAVQVVYDAITQETTDFDIRVEGAVLGILTSPDCAVSE